MNDPLDQDLAVTPAQPPLDPSEIRARLALIADYFEARLAASSGGDNRQTLMVLAEVVGSLRGALSAPIPAPTAAVIDAAHLARQRAFSERTFGPGRRTAGVLDHIRKELREIEAEPLGLEWIDVIILALDGAWRAGYAPQAIINAVVAKQSENEGRSWPDWQTAPLDQAIEHRR